MIAELLAMSLMFVAGDAMLRRLGVALPVLRIGLAVPTALAGSVACGLVLAAARLPVPTVLVLAVPVLVVGVLAIWRPENAEQRPWSSLVGVGMVAPVVVVAWRQGLVRLTPDSYEYSYSSGLFHKLDTVTQHLPQTLEKRSFALSYMSSVAGDLHDSLYMPSLVPLLAASVLVALGAFTFHVARREGIHLAACVTLAIGSVAFVGTISRFLYNASYLNSHMWFAALLLGFVGLALLRLLGVAGVSSEVVAVVGALFLVSMVVSRPEGMFVALTLVLPGIVAAGALSTRVPRIWLGALGAAGIVWYGGVLLTKYIMQPDLSPPLSVTGSLMLSVVLLSGAWLPDRVLQYLRPRHLWSAFIVALGLFASAVATRPAIFMGSAAATYENVVVGEGLWGRSLTALALALLVVTVLSRARFLHVTAFPLVAAVPLSLALAYLRDSAYRVGSGDSLNRMLMHYLPLAVIALVHAAVSASAEDAAEVAERHDA